MENHKDEPDDRPDDSTLHSESFTFCAAVAEQPERPPGKQQAPGKEQPALPAPARNRSSSRSAALRQHAAAARAEQQARSSGAVRVHVNSEEDHLPHHGAPPGPLVHFPADLASHLLKLSTAPGQRLVLAIQVALLVPGLVCGVIQVQAWSAEEAAFSAV